MSLDMQPVAPASFERTPPQDLAAEQCVLGAMMLSKDAIADVVERLREEDFYTPAHQSVFRIILDLYARGEPADAITVSAGLMASGELQRIGGAPYLHTLVASPPLTANASYYAQIVRDASMRRRLVEVGSRIV
ncbi:MAG: replicative DNA helicase, partial [Candidatus Nanopelagicales bacterium]|nr:replicative DNA helicase [Candidatus Nanopelagicales bacterium]